MFPESSSSGQQCADVEALANKRANDLKSCRDSVTNNAATNALFEKEIESLRQQSSSLTSTNHDLTQTVVDLRSHNQKLVKDNKDLKSINTDLTEQLNITIQSLKKCHADSDEPSDEVLFLEKTLNELNSSCQFVENDREKLQTVVIGLEQSLTTSRNDLTKCRSTSKHWKRKFQDCSAKPRTTQCNQKYEKEIHELKTLNDFLINLSNELKENVAKCEDNVSRLSNQIQTGSKTPCGEGYVGMSAFLSFQ